MIKLVAIALSAVGGCVPACIPDATPPCEAGATVTTVATESTPCDLDGSQQLNLTFPGFDGVDDDAARQEADDWGCGSFAVIDGTATGIDCDY